MYYYNGNPLRLDKAFTDTDGNQYPANWLRNSTQEQRDALDITWVAPDPAAYYDQRFYWGVGNPKDLAQLQEQWVAKQKEIAGSTLAQSDWYSARAHDTGVPVPEAVLVYRNQVRVISGQREAQITATIDVDELAALIAAPATISVVTQEYVPADGETPEVPEITEQQANPAALIAWPELGEVVEHPVVDYRTFYGSVQMSTVYTTIRTQAATVLAVNVYCTEFIAAISEAKAGLPQPLVIQQCINDLIGAVTLTEAERTELEGLMATYGLLAIYTLPAA
jgi:hypothetical protein